MILLETTMGMSDELKGAIITALVTGIISIIGFVVTNFSMRRSFRNELAMQRDNTALEKMAPIPYEMLDFFDLTIRFWKIDNELQKYKKENLTKQELIEKRRLEEQKKEFETMYLSKINYLYNTIYAYGSSKAIEIVSKMQGMNYLLVNSSDKNDKMQILACMILLATQVKKDVTAIVVSPQLWLRIRLTDYNTTHEKIDFAINKIVYELDLDKKFLIKQ